MNAREQLQHDSNADRQQLSDDREHQQIAGEPFDPVWRRAADYQFDDYNPTSDVNGSYTFGGSITSAKNTAGHPVNALADFLLGAIKASSYSLPER